MWPFIHYRRERETFQEALSQWAGFTFPLTLSGYTVTPARYRELIESPWPEPTSETLVMTRTGEDEVVTEFRHRKGTRLLEDEEEPVAPGNGRRGRSGVGTDERGTRMVEEDET